MSVPEDEVETAEIEARKQHPREDLLDGAALGDAVLDTLPPQRYRVVQEVTVAEFEAALNAMAARGYALHSFLAGCTFVAVFELAIADEAPRRAPQNLPFGV